MERIEYKESTKGKRDKGIPAISGTVDEAALHEQIGESIVSYDTGLLPPGALAPDLFSLSSEEQAARRSLYLKEAADDLGNAMCFHVIYRNRIAYNSAYGWSFFYNGFWRMGDIAAQLLDAAMVQVLLERRTVAVMSQSEAIVKVTRAVPSRLSGMLTYLRHLVTVEVSIFDKEKHLLNCKNGVVDLRSGKIVSSESNYFTYCVPVEYDPECDFSSWTAWLHQAVGNYDKIADWFQMAVGYSITGYTKEECLFYLYGPPRSGKGTFTTAMLMMLGEPLANATSFSTFTRKEDGQRFDLAPLKACRFVAASESSRHESINEAKVKEITGRDKITCSFKGKDQFSYFPQYKIWLSSNHPIIVRDVDDDAFWSRIKVIEFPHSHVGSEDKDLKDKMARPEYQTQILAYAILGAKMWSNEPKGLVTPQVVKDATTRQRDDQDSVKQWIEQNTRAVIGERSATSRLYTDYVNFCNEVGFTPKKANSFGLAMKAKGYEQCKLKGIKIGNNPVRGYINIVLNDDAPNV